jgi:hypothetical protein
VNFIVDLVKLGFLGFAAAIVFYSFSLMNNVMNCDQIKEGEVVARAKEIRIFMAMSILVIIIGMIWEFFNPRVAIVLNFAPDELIAQPGGGLKVKLDGNPIDLAKNTKVVVSRDTNGLSLDFTGIYIKLKDHENQLDGLKNLIQEMKQAQEIQAGITKKELEDESGT